MRIRWPAAVLWLLLHLAITRPVVGQERFPAPIPVTGVVVDAQTGSGVPGTTIRLLSRDDDGSRREVGSDRDGRFHLRPLPPGRYKIEAAALSYVSISEELEIIGPTDIRIEIVPEALELDPVVVTTISGGWLARTGFFERRSSGVGVFFTRAEIRRHTSGPVLSDVFRAVPGARLIRPTDFGEPVRIAFRGGCEPSLFVDGNPMMSGTAVDEVLQTFDVEGIEVYRGIAVPARFSGGGSCGAIVVWTREPARGEGTSALLPNLGRALVGAGAIVAAVLIAL